LQVFEVKVKEKFEDASKRFLGIDNLWSYLNKLYGFQIAKTSLKYIDEYLWIRITKELYWRKSKASWIYEKSLNQKSKYSLRQIFWLWYPNSFLLGFQIVLKENQIS